MKTGNFFQALRKANSDWRRDVCCRIEQHDSHWSNFREISYLGFLLKVADTF